MTFSPEIVLGPPGTGKTTTLLSIVDEELAAGTPPERIGYVSFTRRAANEAVERAVDKFDVERGQFEWFRTLHALCYRRLGLSNAMMFAGKNALETFSRHVGLRLSGRFNLSEGNASGYELGDRILFIEVLSRIRGTSLRDQYIDSGENIPWDEVCRVVNSYRQFKEDQGLLDFNDVLEQFLIRGSSPHLDVLLVDEAQDLSMLQWHVVEKLSSGCRRVVVAGDDDQAIYRWAGAAVEHFVNLEGPSRVLQQSWRVPAQIQGVADGIISTVRHRREKVWAPRDAVGHVSWNVRMPEDVLRESKNVLVLARNDFVLRTMAEPSLKSLGVYYEKNDFTSVGAGVRRGITNWERLRDGHSLPVSEVRRVYSYISSRIGVAHGHKSLPDFPDDREEVTMKDLRERGGLLVDGIWHETLDRISLREKAYILAMRRGGEQLSKPPRIRVSTIHAAKGAEADDVILYDKMAPRTWQEMQRWPDDEARVWYVAVTRARERLHVVETRSKQRYTNL